MSHTRNSSPPSFPPGVSLPEFLSVAIPSRCLTPGILSSRRSTFFFILRAFSLGSKITFLIKLCCHFHFWQAIFHTSSVLKRKCFEISKESNFVILNKWNLWIWSMQKWTRLWWGPYIHDFTTDWLFDWFIYHVWLIYSVPWYARNYIYSLFTNLASW